MFLLCFGFLISVIRHFRILLTDKTTNQPSGSQWCPFLTPKWHTVYSSVSVDAGHSETTPVVNCTVPTKRAQLGGLATRALAASMRPGKGETGGTPTEL